MSAPRPRLPHLPPLRRSRETKQDHSTRSSAMEEESPDSAGAGKFAGGAEGGVGAGGGDPSSHPHPQAVMHKGKSCKGCLYYSSLLKSQGRKPMCYGISRTLPQVPGYIVGESEVEATKEGRSLSDFKYACVGYSMFLDNKENPTNKGENQAELPFCAGIELLVDRRASTNSHVPAHVHNKEDGAVRSPSPPPRAYKPPQPTGEEFLNRFRRNAGLVAHGVARNLNRVGNYIKDSLDDIMYRRPK